ncbi:hypothetical protein BSLG_003818 [Batrachochytrium salamandrivorans]|nr:hypothetical protein BSLG_003818 [Batrachochytrium salamandrivorans]
MAIVNDYGTFRFFILLDLVMQGTGLAKLGLVSEIAQVRALYDFVPTSPEELAFKSGDVITVTQSTDPDWWDGELNGLTGHSQLAM